MRVGLIVNPIAGVGGELALKGSDGDLAHRAIAAGAVPAAGARAAQALAALSGRALPILTSAGQMGEASAAAAGLAAEIVHRAGAVTDSADTVACARALVRAGADLLLFAGGDGTARDVLAALGADSPVPVLGIPSGVKMLSGVFATSPRAAGAALATWVERGLPPNRLVDILDRDADGGIRLHGALLAPETMMRQPAKAARDGTPEAGLRAAARLLAAELRTARLVVVGPGATMMMVKQELAGMGTLLGVDAYCDGMPIALDADAATLRRLACDTPARIVLGVIGGQGFLLGRGNQQIPAAILAPHVRAGLDIIASADKLAALRAGELLVDSGDSRIDSLLSGHVRVRTGASTSMMMRVRAA
ncbi:hypothetical protein GVO57_13360 [Sphingomonas changnyeongensis]|uniref:ATP-NAD kinase n=1 Tax=Sphingomonas changnyeongensis TaxID=2698679 RepID=A0A7Z2NY90_9SPHN|nr:NAD(+)/NADH kinase [Sphingomonas changnyeongensis]QHL91600.1 hypothetical protein GVO57_13360 [Sphingomonas changnyeongensis]